MTVQIVVPDLGESVIEATVSEWLVKEGERVSSGTPVVVLETDKIDVEVAAEQSGVLASISRQAGDDVQVGDVLGMVEPSDDGAQEPSTAKKEKQPEPEPAEKEPEPVPPETSPGERISPVARRLAEAHNIDPSQIEPATPGKRITKEDVQALIDRQETAPTEKPADQPAATPQSAPSASLSSLIDYEERREERIKMSRRRQTIARRLVEAQQTAAMLTTFNEMDMTGVMGLRKRHKESFKEKHGVSLGLSSFFIKAAIGALKAFPRLNAEIQDKEFVLKHYYDIGVAIGAEEGLVVPVIRDADRLSFAQIEQAVRDYAKQVDEGTLTLESLMGGTFTITNGGVFGSLMSTPILNPPQVGILGLHAIKERPIVIEGELTIRPMMYIALSYDHRMVDGREAVQFLVRFKELIESPEALLIEG
jgi:2-oxoglutarate dehydrogenase E2 component (dihydrolipoamide succinyltransferase)